MTVQELGPAQVAIDPACKVCHSSMTRHVYNCSRGAVYKCGACQVLFVDTDGYSEDLFYEEMDAEAYAEYFEPFRKQVARDLLSGLHTERGQRYLDVGASFGWMVEVAREFDLDAYGIEPGDADPQPDIADRIFRATLREHAASQPEGYDLITMWHVLEHVDDPVSAVQDLAALLAPGGRVIIGVPTSNGYVYKASLWLKRLARSGKLLDELYYTHNPNMHRFYFNQTSLLQLSARCGLEAERLTTVECFDWDNMHKRLRSPVAKLLFKAVGPVVKVSGLTRKDAMVLVCRRSEA